MATKYYVRAHEAAFGPLVVANLCEKYRVLHGADMDENELEFAFDWDYTARGNNLRFSATKLHAGETHHKGLGLGQFKTLSK